MRLIVAEKPSLARAIAAAIPGQHRPQRLHIQCSTGDVVAWCAGHVLEMAPPEDYASELATWSMDALPIVPQRWKHRVCASELVASIRSLLPKASRVVHAGDPDREGQLLVDEVLVHLGWRGPTDRLRVTDLSPGAVRQALAALEPNDRFRPLYEAALARQRADWLFGINMTRLYTLRARAAGYRGVLSVGRVQTPLLGLIVRRDQEIEAFVSRPFYRVEATLQTGLGEEFQAEWAVGKEHGDKLDVDGRLLDRALATSMATEVAGKLGTVTAQEKKPVVEGPPLPYSLAALQIDAGRRRGLSAARVLEVAQRLYERQLITYPRSDCAHLPEAQFVEARAVLAAVQKRAPGLAAACASADGSRRSRAWNDRKVTAHHAIIPTAHAGELGSLEETEALLYELIARRYVAQFLPPAEFLQTRVELQIGAETFVARGREVIALGWKTLEAPAKAESTEASGEEEELTTHLPPLRLGERVACRSARAVERRTQPPKAFTDATLIQAMCNVAKFVTDAEVRKILEDTDGIGTPATRASIIETLFARGYVERRGRAIRATALGQSFIAALPSVATKPDQTALWEAALRRIADGVLGVDRFTDAVSGQIGELVSRGRAAGALPLSAAALPAATSGRRTRSSRRSAKGSQGRSRGPSGRRRSAEP